MKLCIAHTDEIRPDEESKIKYEQNIDNVAAVAVPVRMNGSVRSIDTKSRANRIEAVYADTKRPSGRAKE